MIYFKWCLLVFVNILTKFLINYPLAPIIVLFADNNGWLPGWLYWFQTPDNSLDGDSGWQTENRPYKKESNKYKRWVNRFSWLHRNALYGFSEQVLGIKYDRIRDMLIIEGDPNVSNGPPGRSGIVRRYLYRDSTLIAWQFYYIRQYKSYPNKCIRINMGWKLWSFQDNSYPSAHFVFSPSPYMHFTL